MNERRLIYDDVSGLKVFVQRQPSEDFSKQLAQAEFGTEGLRYRRLQIHDQPSVDQDSRFFELRDDESLLGIYEIKKQTLLLGGTKLQGYYRGSLSIATSHQGRGLSKLLVGRALEWIESDLGTKPGVSWGCVESKNHSSLAVLSAFGFREIGRLSTMMLYRQWPKPQDNLQIITPDTTYATAGLSFESDRVSGAQTYGIQTQGNTVAQALVKLTAVDMGSMGTVWDSIYKYWFRFIPAVTKRFNPRDFRYLNLIKPNYLPGHEREWRTLVTGLLAKYQVHMAMCTLDSRSSLLSDLTETGVSGYLAKSTQQTIHVLASLHNLDDQQEQLLLEHPLGIYPLDS